MNYLAHAYLSFNQPAVLAGNLFSDFVKGKQVNQYPEEIRKGILLHRAIDSFTDEHPATREAKIIFKPYYRLYSAAFIDVSYDHFLANDWQQFTDDSLQEFSQQVYVSLDKYLDVFPEPFRQLFPYMKQYNWLYNYRNRSGIERSFAGVVHRSQYLTDSQTAFKLFEDNYHKLEQYYADFFPALHKFTRTTLERM
ncbi:ACP phosphodiesterase [Longitalea luteola]|uniref:acyl carrier protein phosphodiesterase n=1 Tax=Longitalea luteola TaxID=2812563 RepID=UPI001A96D97A|nr:ACP phosphodiesterase [Longitalea luteola]